MNQAKLIVGASTKNENILWATKFFAPDEFVFAKIDSKKIMVVRDLEYDRAKKEAEVDEVLLAADLQVGNKEKSLTLDEQALLLLRRYRIWAVTVQPEFPASAYTYLVHNGMAVQFADPLFPEREIKTRDEIADITYAQRAMEEVFPMLIEILANAEIRHGRVWSNGDYLTSETLRLIFDSELMKRDCLCDATIIASGDQAADPHCLGYGPIGANTPIVFDMFPRSRKKWYWSDMSRTLVKGKLSSEARSMYDAVLEAQQRGVDAVRAGADYPTLTKTAANFFEERGFKTGRDEKGSHGFFHSIGHGVGLEIHERPFSRIHEPKILEAGNVITIEPGLYYKGIGGVRIEDTVVVTEDGCENLARPSKECIELP